MAGSKEVSVESPMKSISHSQLIDQGWKPGFECACTVRMDQLLVIGPFIKDRAEATGAWDFFPSRAEEAIVKLIYQSYEDHESIEGRIIPDEPSITRSVRAASLSAELRISEKPNRRSQMGRITEKKDT
jgi:hypothetical protein